MPRIHSKKYSTPQSPVSYYTTISVPCSRILYIQWLLPGRTTCNTFLLGPSIFFVEVAEAWTSWKPMFRAKLLANGSFKWLLSFEKVFDISYVSCVLYFHFWQIMLEYTCVDLIGQLTKPVERLNCTIHLLMTTDPIGPKYVEEVPNRSLFQRKFLGTPSSTGTYLVVKEILPWVLLFGTKL